MARTKGLPWSIYMDHRGSLFRNDDHWSEQERQRGKQNPTQVGPHLEALGIEPIYALSAQAKGRIERLWATLQDRLVSELRLAGARTLEQANAVLKRLIPEHNRRFAIAAAVAEPAWRQPAQSIELERACSFGYQATVLSDNTVRIQGAVIDLGPGPQGRSYAHVRVEVRQLLDGSWRVYYRDQLIGRARATGSGELRALKGRRGSGRRLPLQCAHQTPKTPSLHAARPIRSAPPVRATSWPAPTSCPARCIALPARTQNLQFFARAPNLRRGATGEKLVNREVYYSWKQSAEADIITELLR